MKRHVSQYERLLFAPCNMAAESISKKVFVKNSSLVTSGLNTLTIKTLLCDELHFQLVTLLITTCRNVKNFGQKRAEMAGCDEL